MKTKLKAPHLDILARLANGAVRTEKGRIAPVGMHRERLSILHRLGLVWAGQFGTPECGLWGLTEAGLATVKALGTSTEVAAQLGDVEGLGVAH